MSAGMLVSGIVCMGVCFSLPLLKCLRDAAVAKKEGAYKDDKGNNSGP